MQHAIVTGPLRPGEHSCTQVGDLRHAALQASSLVIPEVQLSQYDPSWKWWSTGTSVQLVAHGVLLPGVGLQLGPAVVVVALGRPQQ